MILGENISFWCHDTQLNDTQHNDTQRNDIQHNNKLNVTLSIKTLSIKALLCWLSLMLSVTYAECHIWALNAECHIWPLYDGWHHAECHYAECHCAECRGSLLLTRSTSRLVIWNHWWNNFWLFQFLLHHQFSFVVLLLEKTQNWSSFFI
jgi:hypothetical protein